jgi:hypothetical protein
VLACDLERPGIGLVVAREDLQQGRLSCAVLTHQRSDSARGQVEVDARQGAHTGEPLVYASRAQRLARAFI